MLQQAPGPAGVIRAAEPGDAAAIAGVQHRAWWRAYTDWVDPERFGTLEERVARWREHLEQPERTLVLAVEGAVAGFASTAPARGADGSADVGELVALYVDPPAQGAGVGGALLAAVEERLRRDGCTAAILWVFTRNEHARHVYERHGWSLDDVVERHDDWAPEVRYRLAL